MTANYRSLIILVIAAWW